MYGKKLLFLTFFILIFGSITIGNCEINKNETPLYSIDPNGFEIDSFHFNSSYIVFGDFSNDTSIDFIWTGPEGTDSENSLFILHNRTEKDDYHDFSFASRVQGKYTITMENLDKINTVNITMVYFTQYLPESEFENMRSSLMSNYSSQTITHAGYVLGQLAALVAVLYKWEFFNKTKNRKVVLCFLFISILILTSYFLCRLIYWANVHSNVLYVTSSNVDLTEYNNVVSGIQYAATIHFKESVDTMPQSFEWFSFYFKFEILSTILSFVFVVFTLVYSCLNIKNWLKTLKNWTQSQRINLRIIKIKLRKIRNRIK